MRLSMKKTKARLDPAVLLKAAVKEVRTKMELEGSFCEAFYQVK